MADIRTVLNGHKESIKIQHASCSKQCQLAASIASHTLVATAELLQSAKIVRASVKRLAKYGFAMLTVLTMPPLDGACTNWLLPA